MNARNGTDVDAANAMKVFSSLGYKVKVHNDQTVEQMRERLVSGESEAESVPFVTAGVPSVPQPCHTCLVFQPQCKITAAAPLLCAFC